MSLKTEKNIEKWLFLHDEYKELYSIEHYDF